MVISSYSTTHVLMGNHKRKRNTWNGQMDTERESEARETRQRANNVSFNSERREKR